MTTIPKPGDRIRLDHMPNDPDPIPAGTMGTVVQVQDLSSLNGGHQITVDWDINRSLNLVLPEDQITICDADEVRR